MSFFFYFLVRLSSEINDFVPVSISFILNGHSLNIVIFRDFSKIPFQVSLYTRRLEIHKIFRLSWNLSNSTG